MAFDPISAALGIGSAIFGGIGAFGSSAAQDRAIANQYKYDNQLYDFNWRQQQREYQYRVNETQIQRENNQANRLWQYETAMQGWKYDLAIRDYEYKNQVKQYNKSEEVYGMQLGFNNQAANVAYEAENRKLQELVTGMSFDQQDLVVQMLQEEGSVQAAGISGRSAGKALASVIGSYGRNQAILAESLTSAKKEHKVTLRQIATEKYGADLNAHANRMLKPEKAPNPMAPIAPPMINLVNPMKPEKGPRPIKGTNTSGGSLGIISSVGSGVMGAIGSAYKP